MKKHLRSMWTLGTFATLLTVGITLNAQQSTSYAAIKLDRPVGRAAVATRATYRPDGSTAEYADASATQPDAGSRGTGRA